MNHLLLYALHSFPIPTEVVTLIWWQKVVIMVAKIEDKMTTLGCGSALDDEKTPPGLENPSPKKPSDAVVI